MSIYVEGTERRSTWPRTLAKPPVVDQETWRKELDELRRREKAATRELDAIAAQRRRLPMVEMADYTLIGEDGPVRLVDVFEGRSQLIVYNHMWEDGAEWQCGGCTGFTSQFTRLEFLDNYDAQFVIVTNGPIEEALAYRDKVGNKMKWYSSSESSFGADVDAPPGAGFGVNVFLRDGDKVYRTWHTNGRGTEQLSHSFALIDLLPWGRQEEWQDSPERLAAVADVLEVAGLARYREGLRRYLTQMSTLAVSNGRQTLGRCSRRVGGGPTDRGPAGARGRRGLAPAPELGRGLRRDLGGQLCRHLGRVLRGWLSRHLGGQLRRKLSRILGHGRHSGNDRGKRADR